MPDLGSTVWHARSPRRGSERRATVVTITILWGMLTWCDLPAQDLPAKDSAAPWFELTPEGELAEGEVTEPPIGPTDPRFFGRYCNTEAIELCEEIAIVVLGKTVARRTVCADVSDIEISVEHHETNEALPRGVLRGSGTIHANGEPYGVCFAGRVTGTGSAAVTGTIPGAGHHSATALLSSDATALSIASSGKTLRLDKTACDNEPPTVLMVSPSDGAVLNRACPIQLRGSYTDDHDAFIPSGRARFHSHVDGVLEGEVIEQQGALTLRVTGLSPGHHAITFLATDSGGLEDGRTVSVHMQDRPFETCASGPISDAAIGAVQGDSP